MIFRLRKNNEMAIQQVNKLPSEALRRYLSTKEPDLNTPVSKLELLALDFETTGLDPIKDHILSAGWVPITDFSINLSQAKSMLISGRPVGQSAVIHQLTDDVVAQGKELSELVDKLLTVLQGKVILAHYATIETQFLAAAIWKLYSVRVRFPSIDTMNLGRYLATLGFHRKVMPGQLRLWRLRTEYGLPVYRCHDALTDALGCAELFLAEVSEIDPNMTYRKLRRIG